jgi:hypothetical protein
MNIYSKYVYPDKLVSPVNGYSCRKITKQNIVQFGFSSIEELDSVYPGFPTHCHDLRKMHSENYNYPNRIKVTRLTMQYEADPSYCKQCHTMLPYKKRNSQFCNRSCSASFNNKGRVVSETTIDKAKITRTKNKHQHNPFRGIGSANSRYIDGRSINRRCVQCGNFSGSRKTCSPECLQARRSTVAKQNAAKIGNRSTDEIKLFDLCSTTFKCFPNHIIDSGWDADIVLPDQKIAILWNGPWHYRDMKMTNHSLPQVQTRDRIKTKLFESLGWTVLVYEDRYYTPETAFAHISDVVAGMGIEPI